jgi:hypothetical protein
MTEPTYTIKEIMDIQFKGIDHKLDDIKNALKEQNLNSEKRFIALEADLKETQSRVEQQDKSITRIVTIGGTVWAAITLLEGFILNRIF